MIQPNARRRTLRCAAAALLAVIALGLAGPVHAADEAHEAETAEEQEPTTLAAALRTVGLALAAAAAIGLSALATARVQAAVGAGGTGALAEKPDLFVPIVILIAIPETLVVLGFVVALLLWSMI